ncbi:SDR family oxidoreductase [Nonomuraea recticatena]|uniref:SDR family oxidoreductase n=1 Tax=Nonomuraea recticatena TaxID=46178 RepID=UPI00361F9B70
MRGVLVIGSSSPIGRAIGRAFAADGDTVVGVALEEVDEPAFTRSLVLDCASAEGAEAAVEAVADAAGRLDVVVLAAAVMPVAPITETTDAQWRAALDAVLGTAFAVSRAALPGWPPAARLTAARSSPSARSTPSSPRRDCPPTRRPRPGSKGWSGSWPWSTARTASGSTRWPPA